MQIKSPKALIVYQKAYTLAMKIFEVSKSFPAEEKYSLTHQIRRSSRSVCTNLREAWANRKYEAHFVSKLTDADDEQAESRHWLDTAAACNYISEEKWKGLLGKCSRIRQMLGTMMAKPEKFCKQSG